MQLTLFKNTHSAWCIKRLYTDGVRANVHNAAQLEALYGVRDPDPLAPVHDCSTVTAQSHHTQRDHSLGTQQNINPF